MKISLLKLIAQHSASVMNLSLFTTLILFSVHIVVPASFSLTISSLVVTKRDALRTCPCLYAQKSKKNDAVLRFVASYTYTSSPVYLHRHNNTLASHTLHDFFKSDEHRNCLLIGSNNMKVRKPLTLLKTQPKQMFDWCFHKESMHFKSYGIEEYKNQNTDILELLIKTPFLVFAINASALIGIILTKDGEREELFVETKIHSPEYQFLLLAEDFEADGPPPLVWIFNQLTGRGNKKSLQPELPNDPHTIHTYLRVWASDAKSYKGDIKADRIVFKASCRAEININFPSILLQILPVPKEIIEKQGNKALLQSMERDIVPGVNEFREAFIRWGRKHNDI